MKKVELKMNEEMKYKTIKKLSEQPNPNKKRAAQELHCTERTVNRLLAGYKKYGKSFFSHKNKGKKPFNAVSKETEKIITKFYSEYCYDATFKHFTEILEREKHIILSVPTITKILEKNNIYSMRMTKKRKKEIRKLLENALKNAKGKKEKNKIHNAIVELEDCHSRRPRCKYMGELLQMDASSYEFVKGQIWHLHVAIDDASGKIVGAYFDTQETLKGYYNVLYQILINYGIPYEILTDRRTVFEYMKKSNRSIENDSYTQFAYACNQLGINLNTTSVPQTKGRVEKLNDTLQLRLPTELRLAGITTIETANKFLKQYINLYNEQFALKLNSTKTVFVAQPSAEKINLTLAVLCERIVDAGHCIRYENKYYRMLGSDGVQIHYNRGTSVMVINAFNGNKYCCVNDINVHALEEIPTHVSQSPNFDLEYAKPKEKKIHIPPLNHPWRKFMFGNFVKKQRHHLKDVSEQYA